MAHNSPPSNPTDASAQDLLGQDDQPLEVSADGNSSSDALDAEQLKKAADTINQSTSKQVDSDQNNKLGVEIDLD